MGKQQQRHKTHTQHDKRQNIIYTILKTIINKHNIIQLYGENTLKISQHRLSMIIDPTTLKLEQSRI